MTPEQAVEAILRATPGHLQGEQVPHGMHPEQCWRWHAWCMRERVLRVLRGEEP